jgi:hypothetical protein
MDKLGKTDSQFDVWAIPPEPEQLFSSPNLGYYEKVAELHSHIDNSHNAEQALHTIPVANGYSIVVEPASDGSAEGYIPARVFTMRFSRRQIPVAPPGSYLYLHDIHHVPGYLDIFSEALFADTVAQAANNALAGGNEMQIEEQCTGFTSAIDNFSGLYALLVQDFESTRGAEAYTVAAAKDHLAQLVHQAYGVHSLTGTEGQANSRRPTAYTVYSTLCTALRIDFFELAAKHDLDSRQTGSILVGTRDIDFLNFEE